MIAGDDRDLLRALDATLREAAVRAGSQLACRPGCDPCCIGPFPITALDARRLREGLGHLERTDPARAADAARRARQAVAALRGGFPGDAETGALADDDEAVEAFLARHSDLPCPVLDPVTRTCDLYEHRPVSCRTYGPPVLVGSERLAPCALCFRDATPVEVERCRVEIDPEGAEPRALGRLGPEGERETLVAFALEEERGRTLQALQVPSDL